MKTFLKSMLAIAAIFIASLTAQAQYAQYAPQSIPLPSVLAAGTTNFATPQVIGALTFRQLPLSLTIGAASPGATNTYTIQRSVDGVNYDTNAADATTFVVSIVGAGNNTWTTNWDSGGYGYFRISSIVTVGTATNVSSSYGQKLNSP